MRREVVRGRCGEKGGRGSEKDEGREVVLRKASEERREVVGEEGEVVWERW
jgi:hypothetical protein